MKKLLKYNILLVTIIIGALLTTGCTTDDMENIDIIVTNYPNEYVTKNLYSEHATISSIYPDGVDIDNYNISEKQKKDFSKKDLFIYNGLIEKERELAIDLLELNKDLKIIDSTYVLETNYSPEELWLNPSSLLMMAQNIRLGLEEYITSNVLKEEIEEKYETLKINLSELDADYRLTIENTNEKIIIVDNSALKFLEKFGLEVYCIDKDASDKTLSDVKNLIANKKISYIYNFKGNSPSDNANDIIANYNDVKILSLHKLDIISDSERSEKKDYLSIMNENLELIKQELYQ
ncbi:MAG: metal ABC transporter substrate-binding protein [bacterium]|nr:metal ABC transporter substrate-binding protein [bacterium]